MNNNSIETYETNFELHTHHYLCNHALGTIRDYIESAINQGFHIIGISDHTPHFYGNKDQIFPGITMRISEFPLYIEEVRKLKKEYEGKIDVLLGVESDFFPQHIKVYENQLKQYPFDYIIGSVHFVDNISIFDKRRWEGLTELEKVKTKESYFDLIQQAAKCGLFQIIGHLDAMKGMYPEFSKI